MAIPFDIGFLLIGIVCVSLVWGIGCAIVGGILRFDLAQYINEYISDLDASRFSTISDNMIVVPKTFDKVDLGSWSDIIGVIAILVGVIVILYSLIGAVGGLLKHTTLLFVLIGTVLMCIMLQFVLLWMIFDSDNSFHDSAKDDLVKWIKDKYELGVDANCFSKLMNAIMLAGECCGVRSTDDFSYNLTYIDSSGTSHHMPVSPACCKQESWDRAAGDMSVLYTCISNRDEINTIGCYDTVFDDAKSGSMGSFFVLLILMMVWELLVIGAAVGVLFWHEDETRSADSIAKNDCGPTASQTNTEGRMSIFTPFSKMSSFQNADIDRIKSTEIW